jgi:hypothetical protein
MGAGEVDNSLGGCTFRAGGSYELIVYDRLPAEERLLLAELCEDPDFYGILRPRDGTGRTIKTVDRDTALLWLTLQTPGALPFFARDDGETARRRLLEFVLDGALEIEQDGEFVSGSAALSHLRERRESAAEGRLSKLSHDALRHGQALRLDDPEELSARLYSYGAIPLTAAWERRLLDGPAVLDFLGAADGTSLRRDIDASWRAHESGSTGWLAFSGVNGRRPRTSDGTYKLYASVLPSAMPAAFAAVVDALSSRDRVQFKVGANAAGLLRPDKLVMYFDALEPLLDVAAELAPTLAALPPHGVPFTAEVARDGTLSWGMDPPRDERTLSWQGNDSWRLWLVRRLAAAIIAAQHDRPGGIEPWQFALERLRLDGVDVDRWSPSHADWWAA